MCYNRFVEEVNAMNGNTQKIVATVMLVMLGWLIADQSRLRGYVRTEIADVQSDIADLRERLERLEGQMDVVIEGFVRREG
ncbi:MAG: hypothetical protein OXH99_07880 [Bryobacterales bacterium]|nr:hypothetical protein [Bryobacterales bacterium]